MDESEDGLGRAAQALCSSTGLGFRGDLGDRASDRKVPSSLSLLGVSTPT